MVISKRISVQINSSRKTEKVNFMTQSLRKKDHFKNNTQRHLVIFLIHFVLFSVLRIPTTMSLSTIKENRLLREEPEKFLESILKTKTPKICPFCNNGPTESSVIIEL